MNAAAAWCALHDIDASLVHCPRQLDRMHDFRRLRVWQVARAFAAGVDSATRRFPRSDRGMVGGQLRRAALSIPANVAEGCGKSSRKETVRFLQIACGSARESENHIIIATDLGYLTDAAGDDLLATAVSIQRMLVRLMAALSASQP